MGTDLKLSTTTRSLLRAPGVSRALAHLFNFYRKVHVPHGSKVLFSDIEEGSKTVDVPEVTKFAVDFGLVPSKVSAKDIEAVRCHSGAVGRDRWSRPACNRRCSLAPARAAPWQMYRAQQKMGHHLGRGSKLGKAAKRRELASAQAQPLTFAGFQGLLVRIALQAKLDNATTPGASEVRLCAECVSQHTQFGVAPLTRCFLRVRLGVIALRASSLRHKGLVCVLF